MMFTKCSPVLLMLYLHLLLLFASYQKLCLQKCAKMPKKAKKLLIIRYYPLAFIWLLKAVAACKQTAFVNASVPIE